MGVYSVADSSGNDWCLGIRELPSKSADDTLEVFKEILEDISSSCESLDGNPKGQELLSGIENTMSDMAATEVKFNSLLETYINDVIPLSKQAEEVLDDEGQAPIVRLNHFFCGLHSLVHMTESACATHKEWEKTHYGDAGRPVYHPTCARPGESGGSQCVQEACKVTVAGADEKNGCHSKFMTFAYLTLKADFNLTRNPLTKFLGARFNILGRNAVYVYCLRFTLTDFLKFNDSNLLLKSLRLNLNEPGIIAQVRVHGILSKLISVPLWNVLEDKSVTLADMNGFYGRLIQFFDSAAQDPTCILEGQSPFPEAYINRDIFLEKLLACNESLDGLTTTIMGLTMAGFSIFARRQFKDHLTGGIHENLTNEQCKGVPKTNKKPESYFAFWDKEIRRSPAVSSIAVEAKLLWTMNKPSKWLESLDDDERRRVIEEARKHTPAMKAKFKERQQKIMEVRAARLRERQEQEKAKEERALKKRVELLQKVEMLGGMWKSVAELEEGLKKVKGSARGEGKGKLLDALKTQIDFRRKILQQPVVDAKDWTYSENGKALDVAALSAKLVNLIHQSLQN